VQLSRNEPTDPLSVLTEFLSGSNRLLSPFYSLQTYQTYPVEKLQIKVSGNNMPAILFAQGNVDPLGTFLDISEYEVLMHIIDVNDAPSIVHPETSYVIPEDCIADPNSLDPACNFGQVRAMSPLKLPTTSASDSKFTSCHDLCLAACFRELPATLWPACYLALSYTVDWQFFAYEGTSSTVELQGVVLDDVDIYEQCPLPEPAHECARMDVVIAHPVYGVWLLTLTLRMLSNRN